MKLDHTVATAMLLGLVQGTLRMPPAITDTNRHHRDRGRPGSPEAVERMAAAAAKRARKAARGAQS